MLDILSGIGAIELIERTSSTLRVQQVVQLSLAPAFLLAGIGAVMNVMTNRLIWVANKIERILNAGEEGDVPETPDGTPPVVDPAKKRRQGAERPSDNKRGENDRAAERALAPAQEGGRDGAGEADLDKSRSD